MAWRILAPPGIQRMCFHSLGFILLPTQLPQEAQERHRFQNVLDQGKQASTLYPDLANPSTALRLHRHPPLLCRLRRLPPRPILGRKPLRLEICRCPRRNHRRIFRNDPLRPLGNLRSNQRTPRPNAPL